MHQSWDSNNPDFLSFLLDVMNFYILPNLSSKSWDVFVLDVYCAFLIIYRWTAAQEKKERGKHWQKYTHFLECFSNTTFFSYTIPTDSIKKSSKMPRCFMAKKLKYPYEQWKQEQQEQKTNGSRSPSPLLHQSASSEADLERSNQLSQNSSGQLSHSKSHVLLSSPRRATVFYSMFARIYKIF